MKLFVDTSALVALADRRDQSHRKAAQCARAHPPNRRFWVSDYVLDETTTILRRRIGHGPAVQFVDAILSSRLFEVVRVNERLWAQAWELFKAHEDQTFSFTDCTSFVLMKAEGITTAFTFDRDFLIAGFAVIP